MPDRTRLLHTTCASIAHRLRRVCTEHPPPRRHPRASQAHHRAPATMRRLPTYLIAAITAVTATLATGGCAHLATRSESPSAGLDPPDAPSALHIPPGHYPPPGTCRMWYPSRPPGHQPPPSACELIPRPVPPGTWLLRRPPGSSRQVKVSFFDEEHEGRVVAVSYYRISTGERITGRQRSNTQKQSAR